MSQNKVYGPSSRGIMTAMLKHTNGEYGKEVLKSGNKASSTPGLVFRQILAVTATTFSAISDYESGVWTNGSTTTSDISSLVNVAIPAGTVLYGRFYDLTITAGIAVCYIDGLDESESGAVTPMMRVSQPVFTVGATIAITTETQGASIYYSTLNAVPIPGESGTSLYSAAIALPASTTTYYARAYKNGMRTSEVTTKTVTI